MHRAAVICLLALSFALPTVAEAKQKGPVQGQGGGNGAIIDNCRAQYQGKEQAVRACVQRSKGKN